MYKNKGVANQNDDCAFLSPTAIIMFINVAILQQATVKPPNIISHGKGSKFHAQHCTDYCPYWRVFLIYLLDTHYTLLVVAPSYSSPQGPLNDNEVISYTHQILKGLVYLHDKKVIHRDLRSRNILISGEALCHPRY